MIKIIPPGSYDFDDIGTRLVKIASGGLGFHDRRTLVKQAGEGFVAKLAKLSLLPGDELALNVALSTTEAVGPNRNGDGFRDEWCRRNHDTFRKHARCFRNHRNRSDSPYYGLVKLSHFNEAMQRIELGLVYNGTKAAAERNGGLVADLEMEKLARGDVFDSSMACVRDPATPVLTPAGCRPISEIAVGDLVVTHLGRLRPVTALRRRRYTGGCVKIRTHDGACLDLTEDHLLWAIPRGESAPAWYHCRHLNVGDLLSCSPSEAESAIGVGLRRIASVSRYSVGDAPTWNFEVEEDHSYTLYGIGSHNCLVKNDVCSGCGHKAKSRDEYCRGNMCKYGGLYDNIGRTFADGHHLHADNPDPDWFDISHIVGGRGADRTSFTLGLVKRAAEKVACGAQLADEMGLAIPFLPDLFGPAVARHAKVACDLTARGPGDETLAAAFSPVVCGEIPYPPGGPEKVAYALRALADARVVLPVAGFLRLAGAGAKEAAAAAPAIAGRVRDAYAAILADGEAGLASNPFVPGPRSDGPHRKWAAAVAASTSLEPAAVFRRLALASVRGAEPPSAGRRPASPGVDAAARAYALYKIAALAAIPDADRDGLMAAARAQDRAPA